MCPEGRPEDDPGLLLQDDGLLLTFLQEGIVRILVQEVLGDLHRPSRGDPDLELPNDGFW